MPESSTDLLCKQLPCLDGRACLASSLDPKFFLSLLGLWHRCRHLYLAACWLGLSVQDHASPHQPTISIPPVMMVKTCSEGITAAYQPACTAANRLHNSLSTAPRASSPKGHYKG